MSLTNKIDEEFELTVGDSRYLLIPEKQVLLQSTNPMHYFIFLS